MIAQREKHSRASVNTRLELYQRLVEKHSEHVKIIYREEKNLKIPRPWLFLLSIKSDCLRADRAAVSIKLSEGQEM